MNTQSLQQYATELLHAQDTCQPIALLSERIANMDYEVAYRIQEQVIALKEARGERVVGKKIGLTAKAIREQLNVFEPDYGIITNADFLIPDAPLDLAALIAPRLEPEIVFHIGKDLTKGPVSNWQVMQAVSGVSPSFEIVDSRFGRYDFTIFDTIADAASYGRIYVGNTSTPLAEVDLSCLGLNLYKNGHLLTTATSAEVMGHPINAVCWLANRLIALGSGLYAGDVILSGSFTSLMPMAAGDVFEAVFGSLGTLRLSIEDSRL